MSPLRLSHHHASHPVFRDALSKRPKNAPLHVWNLHDTTVSLYLGPNQRLKATVIKKGAPQKIDKVDQVWIQGIPHQAKTSPAVLERFLQDSYVQLRLLNTNEWKIAISHRLRGGGDEQTTPSSTKRKLSPEALKHIKKAIEQAKKSQGKSLVALVGNTGAGKSTIINHLSEVQLKYAQSDPNDPSTLRVVPAEGQEEIAKIGHDLTQSKTLFTTIYSTPSLPFTLADCGGFLGTIETSVQLAVPLSIMYTLQNAQDVRLVICFDHNELLSTKGQRLGELMYTVLGTLVRKEHIEEALKSVIFLFTKAKTTVTCGKMFTPDACSVARTLNSFANELSNHDPRLAHLYEQIAREEGRFIHVYDPTEPISRQISLQLLDQITPIKHPQATFDVPYSKESETNLLSDIGAIAAEVKLFYQRYQTLLARKNQNEEEQAIYTEELENTTQLIDLKGKEDFQEFHKAMEAQQVKCEDKIEAWKKAVQDNKSKIEIAQAALTASEQALKRLDIEGEEIRADYWVDEIDTSAQFDAVDVKTTNKGKRGFVIFGKRKAFATTTVQRNGRDIVRTFKYLGPQIESIVYDPAETDACWSTEKSVVDRAGGILIKVYRSGEGKPAKASIRISIKRKNLPENLQWRLSILHDIKSYHDKISELTLANQRAQHIIAQIDVASVTLVANMSKQELYQEKSTRLLQQKARLQEEHGKLEVKIKKAVQQMGTLREDVVFLKDFLDLCGDESLKQQSYIKSFLALYPTYCAVINNAQTTEEG